MVEDAGRPGRWSAYGPETGVVSGAGWADPEGNFGLHGFTMDPATKTATQLGPCAVNCSNRNEIFAFHRGGANIAFGDGSVRFFRENVSMDIVAATLTRARGEVLSANDF